MPGWGQKAVGKFDAALEDDELFKQIGGQLDSANFDYAQWQRTQKTQAQAKKFRRPPPPPKQKSKADPFDKDAGQPFVVGGGGGPFGKFQGETEHKHGRKTTKSKVQQVVDEAAEKKKAEHIKILQLRIRARRQTIQEYKLRQGQLLEDNIALKDKIGSVEGNAHDAVKKLLRKYEKFRGGIHTLNDKFSHDLTAAKKDLDTTRFKTEVDLAALQKMVNVTDTRLKEKQNELHVLMNYKDKEYPVKALRIAELQKEIENLKVQHEEEEGELHHVVETEVDKFRKEQNRVHTDITEKVTKDAIVQMHPSLKDMALQNMVMEKEIEFHRKDIEEMAEVNKTLEEEVKKLLKDPKTNIRQQLFPEFYPNREKCTPDMDVVLDIPTKEWLPV